MNKCQFPGCNFQAEKNGYCARHQFMKKHHVEKSATPVKSQKPIAAKSDKLKEREKEYHKIVREMLAANNRCELNTPECTQIAQGLHHMKGRGKYLTVRKYLKRACNACNGYVERHPKYALEHGLSISKLSKDE